jgi:hypothetical protein
MTKTDFLILKEAIEELHGCEANYISSEHVRESYDGTVVWDGAVSLFGVTGHPAATMCYAWAVEGPGSPTRTIYAVLRMEPIDSSRDAVRASLALRQVGSPALGVAQGRQAGETSN